MTSGVSVVDRIAELQRQLAAALCITAALAHWSGVAPCPYHMERAKATMAALPIPWSNEEAP